MRRHRIIALAAITLAVGIFLPAQPAAAVPDHTLPRPALRGVVALEAAQAFVEHSHDVAVYVAWRSSHDQALAAVANSDAFLRSLYTPPPPPAPTLHVAQSAIPPTQYVSRSGGHSDAWWHGVTICEQGGRDNPTYGYFSIMDGSAAGLSWSAQEAIANSIIDRAGDGAWAASCVAAAYAASPSG